MQRSTTVMAGTAGGTRPRPLLAADEWALQLRGHGRRVTKQRLAVLGATDRHPHSSADEITRWVREDLPSITPQSVYVVLSDLTELDLVRKFEPPAGPALYETRTGDNHHHAYCIRCGRVEDVDCSVGAAPCLVPSQDHGMTLLSAEVLYRGLCERCQATAAAEPQP
ncbi:transcriptional repressor [Kocuria sp. JC486]|uniref:Transcriptional repressor n=2 Tax=Micrococcaceae TaxID=1268 RepID=A0A3N4A7E1_9MICC|nr:transcriptional repressor [Kocuria sp. JC486]ROZ65545.1 transcriptional repressor [Kocuria soli]